MSDHPELEGIEEWPTFMVLGYYEERCRSLNEARGQKSRAMHAWLLSDLALVEQELMRRGEQLDLPF